MLTIIRAVAFSSLVLLGPLSTISRAQDAKGERPQNEVKLPPWVVTCSNANPKADLLCVMQQSLLLAATGQRIATVTIQRDGGDLVAVVQMPHGVRLPDGVEVAVDDGPKTKLTIESADEAGSYARFALDSKTSDALRAGSILTISAVSLSGEALVLNMSLVGFTKALDILLSH